MKTINCLTRLESERWLDSAGIGIDKYRNLVFAEKSKNITFAIPKNALILNYFATQLERVISTNPSRILWLSNWETDPPDQVILFEKIRCGCGETRPTIEAPGHLFTKSAEIENAILGGLIFLVMAFNWQGYVVGQNQDYVYLGDEFVRFGITDDNKKGILDLARDFKLKEITDIREAWRS